MQMVFPGGVGRWDIRRSTFREGGAQHQLLVLTDLSQTLREEERTAWQRLLRVLGHELNNSLAPIKSVAGSLADLMGREPELAKEDVLRLRLEDKLAALQAEVERATAAGDSDAAEAAHARYIELGTTYVRRFVRSHEPAA